MDITGTETRAQETPQVHEELAPVPVVPYTDIIHVSLGDSTSHDDDLRALCAEFLDGCGLVNLVSMSLVYMFEASTDFIRLGTAAVGSGASIAQLSRKKNGVQQRANSMTTGITYIKDVIPMSNVSRRIQPASSEQPMLRVAYEKSATCSATLILYIHVVGVREHHTVVPTATEATDDT